MICIMLTAKMRKKKRSSVRNKYFRVFILFDITTEGDGILC